MTVRKTNFVPFYLPEHYKAPLAELQGKLPGSFSEAMRAHLRELFKKYRIPFSDKPTSEQ